MNFEEMSIDELFDRKQKIATEARSTNDIVKLSAYNVELDDINAELAKKSSSHEVNGEIKDIIFRNGCKRTYKAAVSGVGYVNRSDEFEGVALRNDESFVDRFAKGEKPLDMGKFFRGAITGNWDGAENEQRAMNMTANGVIVPAVLAAKVLDRARNVSLFMSAGCPVIPMENGNVTIARVSSDPVFKFYDELEEAAASDMGLDGVELKARTARGYITVSRELFYSAQNLHGVILQSMAGAIAEMIDKVFLYGQNGESKAPNGIFNDGNIHVVTPDKSGRHIYNTILVANRLIRGDNGTPDTLAMNANGECMYLSQLDIHHQYVNVPETIKNMNRIVSNSLKDHEDIYSGGFNGTDMLLFDKNAVAVGIQKNIAVRMITDSDECIKKNAIIFEVTAMLDCSVIQPKHICKLEGVTPWVTSETVSDNSSTEESA